ncbi:unnamed protein product [Camellia sinensis]
MPLSLSLSLSLSARKMHGRPRKAPTREEEKVLALKAAKLRPLQSHFLHFHHNKMWKGNIEYEAAVAFEYGMCSTQNAYNKQVEPAPSEYCSYEALKKEWDGFSLNAKAHHVYTEEALDVNAKFLEANPEYLTAWNYRKFAVEHILSHFETDTEIDPDSIKSIYSEELRRSYGIAASGGVPEERFQEFPCMELPEMKIFIAALKNRSDEEELHFTTDLINKNFSNYSSWHNRRQSGHWQRIIGLMGAKQGAFICRSGIAASGGVREERFQEFPCMELPEFVAALKNRSDEEELHFTTNLINENFSNYSSWHNRSVILSHLVEKRAQGSFSKEKVLTEEYDLVHQALFTDPDDQSGWFYHLWLLEQTVKVENPLLVSTWTPHGSNLNVSADGFLDTCASAPVTGLHLNSGIIPLILYFNEAVEGVSSSTITVQSVHNTNKDLIWSPLSTNNSGSSQTWVKHLTFHEENLHSLQTHPVKVSLGHSQGIMSLSGFHHSHPTHFQFTVLIQPHGLQHAEMKSADMISWGDENFHTASKQPCKMDEYSLVVLKQLTSSPESLLRHCCHYRDSTSSGTISGVNVTNYWEAFAIFKDSELTQLDIIGNVVAEQEFKLFLVKILPALNWLDGVELH